MAVRPTIWHRGCGSRNRRQVGAVRCAMTFSPDGPFRGSAAVTAGLLTRGVLRGPRFQRLFPDVYAPAHLENDLLLRSRAAGVLIAGTGRGGRVLRGGAPRSVKRAAGCACRGAVDGAALPVVRVHGSPRPPGPRRARRDHPRGRDCGDDARTHGVRPGPLGTDSDRTRGGCGRTGPPPWCRPRRRHRLAAPHLGARHGGEVVEVLRLTDRRSESPMEGGGGAPDAVAQVRASSSWYAHGWRWCWAVCRPRCSTL